jgi:hypothetical protein
MLQFTTKSTYVDRTKGALFAPGTLVDMGFTKAQVASALNHFGPRGGNGIDRVAGWWFGTWFLFLHNTYIYWDNPSQLTFIFFKMVKTTNQSFFWHPPHRCRTTRSLGAWAFKRRTSIVETAVLFVSWLLDRWLRALNRDLTNEQRKLMRYTLR